MDCVIIAFVLYSICFELQLLLIIIVSLIINCELIIVNRIHVLRFHFTKIKELSYNKSNVFIYKLCMLGE